MIYHSAAVALGASAVANFKESARNLSFPKAATLTVVVKWPRPAEHLVEGRTPYRVGGLGGWGYRPGERVRSGGNPVVVVAPAFEDEQPPAEAYEDAEAIVAAFSVHPRVARVESIVTRVEWVIGEPDVDVVLSLVDR